MKKIAQLLFIICISACLCACSKAESKTHKLVHPAITISISQDGKSMPDGRYAVAFSSSDVELSDEGVSVELEFFCHDYYITDDLADLKVGDSIIVCGVTEVINDIYSDGSKIIINGGWEANGVTLFKEDDGYSRTYIANDYPRYYSIGKCRLFFAENGFLRDFSDYDNPNSDRVTYGLSSMPECFDISGQSMYSPYATTANISDNKIVYIRRVWTP